MAVRAMVSTMEVEAERAATAVRAVSACRYRKDPFSIRAKCSVRRQAVAAMGVKVVQGGMSTTLMMEALVREVTAALAEAEERAFS
jgi:hypothetical protein